MIVLMSWNTLQTNSLIKLSVFISIYSDYLYKFIVSIVIMGHSMGGAIACKTTEVALKNEKFADKVHGKTIYFLVFLLIFDK